MERQRAVELERARDGLRVERHRRVATAKVKRLVVETHRPLSRGAAESTAAGSVVPHGDRIAIRPSPVATGTPNASTDFGSSWPASSATPPRDSTWVPAQLPK